NHGTANIAAKASRQSTCFRPGPCHRALRRCRRHDDGVGLCRSRSFAAPKRRSEQACCPNSHDCDRKHEISWQFNSHRFAQLGLRSPLLGSNRGRAHWQCLVGQRPQDQ
ncbi:unnamed protein product, partial [Polarella glacialis]